MPFTPFLFNSPLFRRIIKIFSECSDVVVSVFGLCSADQCDDW